MKKIAISIATILGITIATMAQNVGIGTNTPTNKLEVVATVTSSNKASVAGINNGITGSAIVGNSAATNTTAVIGSSNNGFGVQGFTNNNTAIAGFASSGYALYASSLTGNALIISGNLKLAGGNTNPSNGAVLTSDAIGNATWKKNNLAFGAEVTIQTGFAQGVAKKVEFVNESYDLQNNFERYNGGATSTSSKFTAPVAGVYHFSSNLRFYKYAANISEYYFDHAQISIVKNGIIVGTITSYPMNFDADVTIGSTVFLHISGDFHLNANDKVWIEAAQFNSSNTAESITADKARFSGHLVMAD